MTKTNKKFMALAAAAALGVAGTAWALAINGTFVVSGNGIAGANGATALTAADVVTPAAQAQASMTGNGTVTNAVNIGALDMGVNVSSGDTISLAPANDTSRKERITGTAAFNVKAMTKNGAGTLVMAGGYANDPQPSDGATWNNYTGITKVNDGTLALRHSNAIGFSSLHLVGDTTLLINDRDMSLGYQKPDGSSFTAGSQQFETRLINDDGTVVQPVHINTDARNLTLTNAVVETAMTGFGIQIHKMGSGVLTINNVKGSVHTGGTHVVAGTLAANAPDSSSSRYDTPLGNVWMTTLNPALDIYANNGTVYTNANLVAPAVWATPTAAENKPAFDNALTIDSGATVIVNRDKAFGAFNGAGNFVSNSYNNGVRPFVTVWNNNDAAKTAAKFNSAFTGNVTGAMNFVLDSRAQNANAELKLQTLRLTGTNKWDGQTWVADGILSAKDVAAIGMGDIRVGLDGSNTTPGNLLSDRTYMTQNAATLHFSGTTTVANKLFTETGNAGLAADNGASVTYNDISVNGGSLDINPFLDGARVNPVGYNGTVRFDSKISYSGTTNAPTAITVERGTLELFNKDSDIVTGEFARIAVASGARLSFGPANQNMEETYQVVPDVEARLMGYVNANNVVNAMQGKVDGAKAVMRFHTLDVTSLQWDNNDRYINVNLTLDNTQALKKGTFIPIIYSVNPIVNEKGLWNVALDQSRVRVFASRATSNTNLPAGALKVTTQAFENVIYAEVMTDIAPIDSGDISPDPKPVDGGSSGCSTGAFASFAGLLLAPLAFLRKKD